MTKPAITYSVWCQTSRKHLEISSTNKLPSILKRFSQYLILLTEKFWKAVGSNWEYAALLTHM